MPYRPDRLDAIASKSVRGAAAATHHLGGLYADIQHADWDTPPANLPREVWDRPLGEHRTAAGQPHEPAQHTEKQVAAHPTDLRRLRRSGP